MVPHCGKERGRERERERERGDREHKTRLSYYSPAVRERKREERERKSLELITA